MKRIATYLMTLLTYCCSNAQGPLLDQWFLNNYLINPAITGIEQYADVQFGYRNQWTGVDGAPESYVISAHTPLNNPRPNKGFTPTPDPPVPNLYSYRNFKYKPHHGVGGSVYFDRIGPFTNTALSGSYAYHLALSKNIYLSAGIGAGLLRQSLDMEKVRTSVQSDPAVLQFTPQTSVTLRPGIWLHTRHSYFGASLTERINATEARTATLTAGHRFESQIADVHLTPYAIFRANRLQHNYDMGLKVDWKRMVFMGATYRSTHGVVLYLGASVNYLMGFSYLYHAGNKGNSAYSATDTHEIQLNFRLQNKEQTPCPQQMW